MVGFFSRGRKSSDRQGFNRYADELNRYQQTSVAGLPNNGQNRTDSLTNSAGQAALAALRMHSTQALPPPQPPSSQYYRSNSLSGASPSVRTNSLSQGNGRANSLRTYVYTPKASYVTGQPQVPLPQRRTQQPRTNSLSSNTSAQPVRRNSLRTNSLNSQSSLRRNAPAHHGLHPLQQQQFAHPKYTDDTLFEEEDDEHSMGMVTTTRTTKVVDAQGRTQSITTETIKTLPDGSNIIETRTKNISRSNSLTTGGANNRTSSLLSNNPNSANYNLNKIDEHLHDFEYSYHEGINNRPLQPVISNGTAPVAFDEPVSPIAGASILEEDSPKPKPLRSILKNSASNIEAFQEKHSEPDAAAKLAAVAVAVAQDNEPLAQSGTPHYSAAASKAAQIHSATNNGTPRAVSGSSITSSPSAAAAAAAAASSFSKIVTSTPLSVSSDNEFTPTEEKFSDALESLDKRKSFIDVDRSDDQDGGVDATVTSHPYQGLKAKEDDTEFVVPNLTHDAITPVTLQPSPVLTTTKKFSSNVDQLQPIASSTISGSNVPGSASSSITGSIKFNDKVETFGYASSYTKPLQPPPSKAISEEEMYRRAIDAAKIRVYGDQNESQSPVQKSPPSRATSASQQAQTVVPQVKDKRTMSITSNLSSLLDEARRNKKLNAGSSPSYMLQQSPPGQVPHFNSDEVVTGSGVKDDYQYQNHHKDFSRHSMRGAPDGHVVDSTRKERAKEEQRFAKQRLKEEKLSKKQAEKEALEARKKSEKEDKKSTKRSAMSFFTKKKEKRNSVNSGSSLNGSIDYETPQVAQTAENTFDSIDETPISTNPLSGGEQPLRANEQLAVSLPITPIPLQERSVSPSPRTPVLQAPIIEEREEEEDLANSHIAKQNQSSLDEPQEAVLESPKTPHIVHVPEINGKKQKRGLFSKFLGKKKTEAPKSKSYSTPPVVAKPVDQEESVVPSVDRAAVAAPVSRTTAPRVSKEGDAPVPVVEDFRAPVVESIPVPVVESTGVAKVENSRTPVVESAQIPVVQDSRGSQAEELKAEANSAAKSVEDYPSHPYDSVDVKTSSLNPEANPPKVKLSQEVVPEQEEQLDLKTGPGETPKPVQNLSVPTQLADEIRKQDFDSVYSDDVPDAYVPESRELDEIKEPLPHPSVLDTESIHKSIVESLDPGEAEPYTDDEAMLDEFTKKLRAAAQTVTREDGEADETFDETFDQQDDNDENEEYDAKVKNGNILGEIGASSEPAATNSGNSVQPPRDIYIPDGGASGSPESDPLPALAPAIKTVPAKLKAEQNSTINGQEYISAQQEGPLSQSKALSNNRSRASSSTHEDFAPPSAPALGKRYSGASNSVEASPKSVQSETPSSKKSKFRHKVLKYFVHTYEK